nr:hypothetical protein [uncultured Ruminococcus sp.]
MKKIQKKLSVVLAVMMVLCMFTALPFSASAAETSEETSAGNKINVTSNVADPVSYDYNAQTEQVVVTYLLKADHMIVDTQSSLTYDSKVLKLASTTTTNTKNKVFPVFQSSIVWNPSLTNQVLFNCSSLNLFNFKSENVYCTFTFDVVGSGDTTVNLNVDYLTGTEAESYDDFFESEKKDIDYIYDSANKVAGAAFTAKAVLVQGEEPTTAPQPTTVTQPTTATQPATQPTTATQPATQPTTVAPSDVPTDGYYVYGDNIKLKLTTIGTDKVGGTIALQKGSYTFKLDNYGTLLGYGKTFTDTTNGLTFNKKFKSNATLVATGGTYTFQVNTKTNTLVVKYDKNLPNEYLIGDINTILSPVNGKTIAVGSTYLAAGTYKFKLSAGNVAYGYNKVINDTTNGASLSLNSKYSSYLTLNATGGTYKFTINTTTKKLVVGYVPAKDEKTDDVHVSGDINLVLDDKGGESNVANGTVKLGEGTYSFKIYNYGTAYTIGAKIVDSGTKSLKSSYTANATLIATGGTYTFSFNKTTGSLTVTKK